MISWMVVTSFQRWRFTRKAVENIVKLFQMGHQQLLNSSVFNRGGGNHIENVIIEFTIPRISMHYSVRRNEANMQAVNPTE
jgi:uncharacterized phosphosugar-binding protein